MSGKCGTRSRASATVRIGRWGIAIVIAAASVASAQMSVPPAEYRPAVAHKAEAASGLRLPQGGHVRRIALPLPSCGGKRCAQGIGEGERDQSAAAQ